MTARPIVFVRHGETDWNREFRLQGQQNVPLNAIGRRQAARNGRALAPLLGGGDWQVLCSPLDRARETAAILLAAAGRADLAPRCDDRLKEICFGSWEGHTLAEVAVFDPAGVRARDADKWGFVPPTGESYAMLAARVSDWLGCLDRPSLIVAHGGILRVLLHLLAGFPEREVPRFAAPQDRAVVFTRRAVLAI